ncbi:Type 1 glutamine amidotransferase-like domain-containing protein, partial [candidate division WWE3 bacterium]|nr:Type 1 glutamine amidotransferase-like domain-containing protein [candidate division WWE3 bacterium]
MDIILTSLGTHNLSVCDFIINHTTDKGLLNMLFVTTGCNLLHNPDFLFDEKQRLSKTDFVVTEFDLVGKTFSEICSAVRENDVIWVHGGKPFYLLKYIRESRFKEALLKEGQNKVYIGQSSGSYVACPNIDMALWKSQ